ncbi:nitroreductase family protein [uncultured Desulfuromusa sp.]|uniref:nitroreductase family protein n=1 Tax=uncultured Desulfuromusa sp. TaxID=219183 RepID=UPI002AA94385|nr:nitroreductase family protein [uncultured Desulfuromusa sp.]
MIDLLRQRRSVRKFKQQPIEDEKLTQLSEALLRAPTSRNQQPCEFVLVDNPDTLIKLSAAKPHGASFFTSAPLAVVIAANPEISDVWIEDSAIAAIVVQLAAEELGLKSCWAQLRLRPHDELNRASDFVRQLVGLPVGMEVAMVIAIGYPAEETSAHPRDSLRDEKIHHNKFS